MFARKRLKETWKEIRPYFIFAAMLFFAGVVIGMTPDAPTEFLKEQIKGLASIAEDVNRSDHPERTMFFLVLLNNITASLLAMGFGVIAGIMPIVMLVTNGLVVGFLIQRVSGAGESTWELVLKGLLPHGLFELTAVFLACAFGMRFGVTLLKGIFGSAFGKKLPWQPFVSTATGAVPALIAIFALLLIGAGVESTITNWLLN
ncbi:stage II sporulation protein M [Cohnella suwonensis]|uniref:Stage II sporulation protein M n=1 Tax=Cohnella suwonensis TaxID=696072 RepID=A0ABW0LVJ9_9BACL